MPSRIQLALNVTDIGSAAKFYTRLFGTEPHKIKPGYANFVISDPPLKLVLLENPNPDGALNHLGVELVDSDAVKATAAAFAERGLRIQMSTHKACCHAVQDKVYVAAPDVPIGQWEFYSVFDDAPESAASADGVCCAASSADEAITATGCCASATSTSDESPRGS